MDSNVLWTEEAQVFQVTVASLQPQDQPHEVTSLYLPDSQKNKAFTAWLCGHMLSPMYI